MCPSALEGGRVDARHFDRLARSLTERGSRRGLLGLLAALPLTGGVETLLGGDAEGKGRRKKKRSRRRQRRQDRERQQKQQQRQKRRKRKQPQQGPFASDEPGHQAGDPNPGGKVDDNDPGDETGDNDPGDETGDTDPGGETGDPTPVCEAEPVATTCEGKCGPYENNCGAVVDCGPCAEGLTCASCAALGNGDDYDPAANCCGEGLVCDCLPLAYYPARGYAVVCKQSGVCRPNRAPAVLERNVTYVIENGRDQLNIPVELTGYEADYEISEMRFRIVTQPTHGFVYIFDSDAAFGPGTPAPPPPPIPEGASMDCYPRCSHYSEGCDYNKPCKDLSPAEWYVSTSASYYPHESTFSGPDSFTYAAIDIFGAESAPMPFYLTVVRV